LIANQHQYESGWVCGEHSQLVKVGWCSNLWLKKCLCTRSGLIDRSTTPDRQVTTFLLTTHCTISFAILAGICISSSIMVTAYTDNASSGGSSRSPAGSAFDRLDDLLADLQTAPSVAAARPSAVDLTVDNSTAAAVAPAPAPLSSTSAASSARLSGGCHGAFSAVSILCCRSARPTLFVSVSLETVRASV
jgi:hypothetical protein